MKHSTFNIQRSTSEVNDYRERFWRIPTGFHLSAQGCEERATLGGCSNFTNPEGVESMRSKLSIRRSNPVGVETLFGTVTQGSSFLATLGCMMQSRWDWVTARMLMTIVMIAVCSQSGFAQSTNAPAKLTYDSFRTVSDRNIFNPNRYARGAGRTNTRASSTPASRVESFTLVGIMAYEKGSFAFFDGTKSDYKHALQADGKIGDYTVSAVTSEHVTIVESTNSVSLKVGMQMRREDEGEWFLSEGGESARKRIVSTRTRTRGGLPGEPSTGGGEEMVGGGEPEVIVVESEPSAAETPNENGEAAVQPQPEADNGGVTDPVLLRLMQRRQQMNQ